MRCPFPFLPANAGQAAVESALVLPLAVFIVLGLLQMGMMQQARLFADYAAFRGARAASLEMGQCQPVLNAELAALTPMLGRADDATTWKQTYRQSLQQQSTVLPHVINFWDIDPVPDERSFDEPVQSEANVTHVHLRMYYYYELYIPFVNWVIGRMYLAQYGIAGASIAGEVDPLHPTTKATDLLPAQSAQGELSEVVRWAEVYFRQGRYVVPLYGSWSMRMFSRAAPAKDAVTAANPCR